MHVDRVVLFDNVAFAVPSATNVGAGDLHVILVVDPSTTRQAIDCGALRCCNRKRANFVFKRPSPILSKPRLKLCTTLSANPFEANKLFADWLMTLGICPTILSARPLLSTTMVERSQPVLGADQPE